MSNLWQADLLRAHLWPTGGWPQWQPRPSSSGSELDDLRRTVRRCSTKRVLSGWRADSDAALRWSTWSAACAVASPQQSSFQGSTQGEPQQQTPRVSLA